LPARGKFGEDQLLCLLFERAPGAQLVSAAPAMNARTVGERPWQLNSGQAASPARKQNAHASEPEGPTQRDAPAERDSGLQGRRFVSAKHGDDAISIKASGIGDWPQQRTGKCDQRELIPERGLVASVSPHRHILHVFPRKQLSPLGPAPGLADICQAGTHAKWHYGQVW
jgi:hypothetical protein